MATVALLQTAKLWSTEGNLVARAVLPQDAFQGAIPAETTAPPPAVDAPNLEDNLRESAALPS